MSENEELEWLREQYLSKRRFKSGMNRGMLLALTPAILISYIIPDIVIFRVVHILICFIIFIVGLFSAYRGRFKVTYEWVKSSEKEKTQEETEVT